VVVTQNGDVVLLLACSFQKADITAANIGRLQPNFPIGVLEPEILSNVPATILAPTAAHDLLYRGILDNPMYATRFDLRPMPNDVLSTGEQTRRMCIWIRQYVDDIDNRIDLHCTAVWVSDIAMVACGLLTLDDDDIVVSRPSLNHAMWLHEFEFSMTDWMLYELKSNINANERMLISGRLWTRSGQLILSTTQEALVKTEKRKKSQSAAKL